MNTGVVLNIDPLLRITALTGGVGGAKLIVGLAALLPAEQLLVVANTGDDFEHLGLRICPDLDSVMYALGGVADQQRGWGRADESWQCMASLSEFGAEDWFSLGDRDLATHLIRTQALKAGMSLTALTQQLLAKLNVAHAVVPMSEAPVKTMLETERGELGFQHYFVRERCEPAVKRVHIEGIKDAEPAPAIEQFHRLPGRHATVICPSNPYLSVDPILQVPGLHASLAGAPIIAVSPIIGGSAVKGPAAKLMRELGADVSSVGIAQHYQGVINALVIDHQDAGQANAIAALGIEPVICATLMRSNEDKEQLAMTVIDTAERLLDARQY